jgi:23S rRNA (cytosine1962-C5)-methyltransferase
MSSEPGYELLDAGDGRRLERIGGVIVDRPARGAEAPRRASAAEWRAARLRFERGTGWIGVAPAAWTAEIDGLRLGLRPTATGQVGLFPEHLLLRPWLSEQVGDRPSLEVLNLFAYTGATTIVLAQAGARVAHVDGSRPAVAWARSNASLSNVADRPIRWIVDEALAFTRREARRGRRYGGIVLDPPSYGHGPDGRRWRFQDALPELLEAVARIADANAFVALTAHTSGLETPGLDEALRQAFGRHLAIDTTPLELAARSGAVLRLGAAACMIRR